MAIFCDPAGECCVGQGGIGCALHIPVPVLREEEQSCKLSVRIGGTSALSGNRKIHSTMMAKCFLCMTRSPHGYRQTLVKKLCSENSVLCRSRDGVFNV